MKFSLKTALSLYSTRKKGNKKNRRKNKENTEKEKNNKKIKEKTNKTQGNKLSILALQAATLKRQIKSKNPPKKNPKQPKPIL